MEALEVLRPLLIGQAPGRRGNAEPLSGRSGRRLSALCGMPLEQYLQEFERINLLEEFPGKAGKGDRFPMREAKVQAFFRRSLFVHQDRRVVLLGLRVAEAFGFTDRAPLLRWMSDGNASVAICPHPSGVSLWWNDRGHRLQALHFWSALACDARKATSPS